MSFRVVGRPHRIARPERVTPLGWRLTATDAALPTTGLVEWDPTVDIRVHRLINLDVAGIRADCGLADGDAISAVVVWHCPTTSLRGSGQRVSLDPGTREVGLELAVVGSDLAGRLLIRTQIILDARTAAGDGLAPQIPGSILWSDEVSVPLGPEGGMFPMEWLDFGASGWLPAEAGWYLDWVPDDTESSALGGIRLYLNAGHETIREAVSTSAPYPSQARIREAIAFDVARTLIFGALSNPNVADGDEPAQPGSVGDVVRRLIEVTFPVEAIDGLRNRSVTHRGRLEAQLQAAMRLFWHPI